MKYLPILVISVLVLLFITDLNADNIYSWTDENGVRQYTNTAPGKNAKDVEIIKEIPHTQGNEKKSRQDANELDRVLDELEAENRAAEIEREEIEAEKKKAAQDELNKKIQTEKERLYNEISRIQKLASGGTFSLAMKKSKIKEYREKLDLLERSPEEYFAANAQ
jgi:Skp family chaperone for outer membrane proteins